MGWDKVRVAVPFTKFILFYKKERLCFVNIALFLLKLNIRNQIYNLLQHNLRLVLDNLTIFDTLD
jgi:hypothetical protein